MNNFQVQLKFAVRTGICPVCHRRPRARWVDTKALRMTCGHPDCYYKWLPGKKSVVDGDVLFPALPHDEEAVTA